AVGVARALSLFAVLRPPPPRHTPQEPLLEFDRSEHPFRQAVLTAPIEHAGGVVRVPEGPGLGIEVDRAALQRFALGAWDVRGVSRIAPTLISRSVQYGYRLFAP